MWNDRRGGTSHATSPKPSREITAPAEKAKSLARFRRVRPSQGGTRRDNDNASRVSFFGPAAAQATSRWATGRGAADAADRRQRGPMASLHDNSRWDAFDDAAASESDDEPVVVDVPRPAASKRPTAPAADDEPYKPCFYCCAVRAPASNSRRPILAGEGTRASSLKRAREPGRRPLSGRGKPGVVPNTCQGQRPRTSFFRRSATRTATRATSRARPARRSKRPRARTCAV